MGTISPFIGHASPDEASRNGNLYLASDANVLYFADTLPLATFRWRLVRSKALSRPHPGNAVWQRLTKRCQVSDFELCSGVFLLSLVLLLLAAAPRLASPHSLRSWTMEPV